QIGRAAEYAEQRRRPNTQIAQIFSELLNTRWATAALWFGMALGMALCYRGGQLPLIGAGLLLLGGLALARPDVALLFVPLTAPLFLVSAALPGVVATELRLPPHELALLASAAALLARAAIRLGRAPERRALAARLSRVRAWLPAWIAAYAPELLFLMAGVLGLLLGAPEPEARRDALRAFRWFVVEPLLFITLVRLVARRSMRLTGGSPYRMRLAVALIVGGTVVAGVGLLQYITYDLVAEPAALAARSSVAAGAWRATSVYGNPNNLGLYLGRVWPLAAALALVRRGERARHRAALAFGVCALLCLGGILVSLSRGAWVGAGAALIVLALPYVQRWLRSRWLAGILVASAALVLVGALIFALRGGPAGGSATVRLLFWRESLALVERHPLGLGLDQFFYYHHPAYGRSLIDPSLANTLERDARQPHNVVFELWLNLGPLGVLAFAWLLARGLWRARAHTGVSEQALAHGAFAALVAGLAHGTVDAFYFWPDLAITFWLLLVLAVETPELARRAETPAR
ncbi:MAG TPA: O-antigen ligase family protein, partial [Roseiflexaceae bacterium]|nr:O-antigen ligase family protein [Roseiflexaceae bacterium]